MSLMKTTARDESTKLRQFVREGWQTPQESLTIIRDLEIENCEATGEDATVAVRFDVLGRLVAPGRIDRVAFEPISNSKRRNFRLIDVDGVLKLDDISSLESHVEAGYAIRILMELVESEPTGSERAREVMTELRGVAEAHGPN